MYCLIIIVLDQLAVLNDEISTFQEGPSMTERRNPVVKEKLYHIIYLIFYDLSLHNVL